MLLEERLHDLIDPGLESLGRWRARRLTAGGRQRRQEQAERGE
jgi:hypothetical protein